MPTQTSNQPGQDEQARSAEERGAEVEELAEEDVEEGLVEDDEESREADLDELSALRAIANLDLEAAMVYEVIAESVDDRELKEMLQSFAQDHRRHVQELDDIVREGGGRAADEKNRVGGALLGLASTLGTLDSDAAVEALIAAEQLTNGTYTTALWIISIPAAEDVLRRNAGDEQRHLEALLDYQERRDADDGGVDATH